MAKSSIVRHKIYSPYQTPLDARLDEPQAGIKIARRNISNLRYTDDTTLMGESLLMKMKEESEKLNIQKPKIRASGPITSWQIDGKQWKQ